MTTTYEGRKVLVKIKNVTHPYSDRIDCQRMVAAIPNMSGRNMSGKPIPSFRKPFFVAESSDMIGIEKDIVEKFIHELLTIYRFEEIELV